MGGAIESGHLRANDLANALIDRGLYLWSQGEGERALGDFDAARKLQPDNPMIYHNRGALYLETGNAPALLADAERLIALRSDVAHGFAYKGAALRMMNKDARALEWLDKSIKIDKGYSFPRLLRGDIHFARGSYQKAIDDWTAALKADAAAKGGAAKLTASAYGDGKFTVVSGLEPTVVLKLRESRASANLRLKKYDAALKELDSLVALNPGNAQAHYKRGLALYYLKRKDQALKALRTAHALAPENTVIKTDLENLEAMK